MKYHIFILLCTFSELVFSEGFSPMELCQDETSKGLNESILNVALIKSKKWSDKQYGVNCITCAEVSSINADTFTIHITSPAELLINTSAEIEFKVANGDIVFEQLSHSCKLHRVN